MLKYENLHSEDFRMMYSRPVTVGPLTWADGTGQVVPTRGIRMKALPDNALRILTRLRSHDFLTPEPSGLPGGSSFTPDWSAVNAHRDFAGRMSDVALSGLDDALAKSESETFLKWTLQRGGYYGFDVIVGGIGRPGGQSIARGMQYFAELIGPSPQPERSRYPLHTNSGPPFYQANVNAKMISVMAGLAARNWDELLEFYTYASALMGAPERPHAIMFTRTGPLRKAQDVFTFTDAGPVHTATIRGGAPRRRDVRGVWSGFNVYLQPYANALKAAVFTARQFRHTTNATILHKLLIMQAACSGYWGEEAGLIEDDISGYDKSVRRIHQEAFASVILDPRFGSSVAEAWLALNTAALLAPPLYPGDAGFLHTRDHGGETTSGEIFTSLVGTAINFARLVPAVAAGLGITEEEAIRLHRVRAWDACVWGDDTLLVVPINRFDVSAYVARSLEIGFECKARPGNVFLMKFFDVKRNTYYPLASRVLQQTVANEHKSHAPELELLGLFARTAGLSDNPIGRNVWDYLVTSPGALRDCGATTRYQLAAYLRDPAVAARLLASIKAHRDVLRDWLRRATSPTSENAALEAAARILGWHDIDELASGEWVDLTAEAEKASMPAAKRLMAQFATENREPETGILEYDW